MHAVMSCLQKAETNDGLCVVCANSAAPWTHFTHPAENRPVCFSLSLYLCISLYLVLAVSPLSHPLENRVVLLCSAVYITNCIYSIFRGPDNRYMRAAVFLADTSLSHLPVNEAIKSAHKRWHFDTSTVNTEDVHIYTEPLIWSTKSWQLNLNHIVFYCCFTCQLAESHGGEIY